MVRLVSIIISYRYKSVFKKLKWKKKEFFFLPENFWDLHSAYQGYNPHPMQEEGNSRDENDNIHCQHHCPLTTGSPLTFWNVGFSELLP